MEYYLGEVCCFAFNVTPRGFMLCDGRLLPINRYQAMFALLGTNYGGDGRTTFALPDLRGKSPVDGTQPGGHYYICVSGIFPSRED